MKVVLDPGHGGNSKSNRGSNGFIEADGVLDIALKTREILKAYPIQVFMTREKDITLDEGPRVNKTNSFNADIVVSIHTNAGVLSACGTETFHSINSPVGKRGNRLANLIQTYVVKYAGTFNRGVKTRTLSSNRKLDYYFMIRNTKPTAVIVECGFHTNPDDERKLLSEDGRYKFAQGIARGIVEYANLTWKEPKPPETDYKALYLLLDKENKLLKQELAEKNALILSYGEKIQKVWEVTK